VGKPHGAHAIHKLTTREVAAIKAPGRHSDGGGLYLSIPPSGGAGRWVWLGTFSGKQIEAGCGSALTTSLADARTKAAGVRDMIARGV
jgi:Arm DNA-binding domain